MEHDYILQFINQIHIQDFNSHFTFESINPLKNSTIHHSHPPHSNLFFNTISTNLTKNKLHYTQNKHKLTTNQKTEHLQFIGTTNNLAPK